MKKILMLGGSRYLLPVIKTAHDLGFYTITCDYLPDNFAHKYSDEYHNVSIIEKDEVLKLAKELKIDGIMSFACDPGVVTAAYVAENMGLPYAGSYEAVSILQDKARFRKFLQENGFNVPKAKGYHEIKDALLDVGYFTWPVIVKPVDSAGSKGVLKVEVPEKLEEAIHYALKYSHSNQFIIEEYIEKIGDSTDCECFSIDGDMIYVSFSNQKFDAKATNPYTPAGFTWPPQMPMEAQEELTKELRRLCRLLNLRTSLYNVEARVGIDGKAYLMEVSPRGGGNRLAEMMHYVSGVDLIQNAVKAAVGEPCDITEMPKYNGFWYEHILHAPCKGAFAGIQMDETFRNKYIVEEDIWVQIGDEVNDFTGANETIGTLIMKFPSHEEMQNIVSSISNYVKVMVE